MTLCAAGQKRSAFTTLRSAYSGAATELERLAVCTPTCFGWRSYQLETVVPSF